MSVVAVQCAYVLTKTYRKSASYAALQWAIDEIFQLKVSMVKSESEKARDWLWLFCVLLQQMESKA